MKKISLYYFALFAPTTALALSWEKLPSTAAVVALLFYVLVFRTFLDGWRLVSKGVIPKKDIWKLILPGMRGKYLKALYLP